MKKKIKLNGLPVKLLAVLYFFFMSVTVFGQSYLGWVTQSANLREGPGTNYRVLETLPAGMEIFIYSVTGENNFYQVKVIETDTDGYISKSLVKLGEVVMEAKEGEGPIQPTGTKTLGDPQIKIFNNTSERLTLMLNGERYVFTQRQTKTITIPAGKYKFTASAPGVLPCIGTKQFDNYEETIC